MGELWILTSMGYYLSVIGKGTKVIEYLQDSGKIYEGEITLGFSTTTEDRSGEIVEKKAVPPFN